VRQSGQRRDRIGADLTQQRGEAVVEPLGGLLDREGEHVVRRWLGAVAEELADGG
jgi:hypothetical protein